MRCAMVQGVDIEVCTLHVSQIQKPAIFRQAEMVGRDAQPMFLGL